MKWDIFISYASEDKAAVAIPLTEALRRRGLEVWLDQNELQVGDILTEKIDHGLANARFGVIILSARFFAKNWPKRELSALVALEDEKKVILPVWHDIDAKAIAGYSPLLAGRVAAVLVLPTPPFTWATVMIINTPP